MRWKRYLLVTVLMLVIGMMEIRQAKFFYENQVFELPSYGNFLIKWLLGIPKPAEIQERQLSIPAEWIVLQGGYLLSMAGCCTQSLTRNSYYELLCSEKRIHWWDLKCRWLMKNTLLYYMVFFAMLLILSFITGNTDFNATSEVWTGGFAYKPDAEMVVATILLPMLGSLCVGLMEMFLELVFSPVLGLLLCSGYLLAGIFTNSALFIGNLTMLYRSAVYDRIEGIRIEEGILASIGGMLLFYFLGRIKMRRWEG